MRSSLRSIAPGVAFCIVILPCADAPQIPRPSTQRERDSVISTLRIPGAKGVGRALTVSDSAASRALLIDTAGQD